MDWDDSSQVLDYVPILQLLADYKYDSYQRFGPGKRFIESLALWLNQFDKSDRPIALRLVVERLIYFSDRELSHIVETAYPDLVVRERIRLVAEEQNIAGHKVQKIVTHSRFRELQYRSLYLGLSDGARTNEMRRASNGGIGNEQIWQAYELSDDKAEDMLKEMRKSLAEAEIPNETSKFTLVWLLDDFSGSGNTYIRLDAESGKFKGKIKKIYDRLSRGDLVDPTHYEVYLLLYVATRQAIDHIEYWSERFAAEHGFKPLQVHVLCPIERAVSVNSNPDPELEHLVQTVSYYDDKASDKHMAVGGTVDGRRGFANCALPLVLSHNTPNNSLYILWGPENYKFFGLFPRVSRHKEF
ncbi:MAG: hypothetical protein P4M05_26395 [Bradyrhizobium sp.]|nr:hypothetical protein [Bradyrhizobium sp.]